MGLLQCLTKFLKYNTYISVYWMNEEHALIFNFSNQYCKILTSTLQASYCICIDSDYETEHWF